MKHKKKRKTKRQRRQWWNSLTPEQRKDYIDYKMTHKKYKKEKIPEGFEATGVNTENKKDWLKLIKSKNLWMR